MIATPVTRPHLTVSGAMDSFENPASETNRSVVQTDEDADCVPDDDGVGGAVTVPNIVPCRAVLDFVLKAFGCDGSLPLFYFWRVVMIIYWLCLCMNSAVSPTYRDRAADPQRPYLSSLHALECVVQLLEGGMAVYCHGVLFGLKTTGQIDRILDSTSATYSKSMTNVAVTTAVTVYLVSFPVMYMPIGVLLFLVNYLPILMSGPCGNFCGTGTANNAPFYANWTVSFDAQECQSHSLGSAYVDVEEAQRACLQLGDSCGGVGASVCDQNAPNRGGPFFICDSKWRPIYANSPACAASPFDSAQWLDGITDSIGMDDFYIHTLPLSYMLLFLGFFSMMCRTIALSFVMVSAAAV